MTKFRVNKIFVLAAAVFLTGCISYTIVTVPPRVDLQRFNTIGVITFDGGRGMERELAEKCTRRFIENMQAAQPGVLVLELGMKEQLLKAFGKTALDADAVKAIAAGKSVNGILLAELEIQDPETTASLRNFSLSGVTIKETVKASLAATLRLGESGALAWSDSARGEWTLAKASLSGVRIADPSEKYNQIIDDLVYAVTRDFRPTAERRVVEK